MNTEKRWLHVTSYSLYVHIAYIYSPLIEEDLREDRNVLVKFLCDLLVYLCLSSGDLFIFSIWNWCCTKSNMVHMNEISVTTWRRLVYCLVCNLDKHSSALICANGPAEIIIIIIIIIITMLQNYSLNMNFTSGRKMWHVSS